MSETSPIACLLADVRRELSGQSWRRRRALLAEVRAHLEDAADDEQACGLDRASAEQRACDRFGPAGDFGRLVQKDTRSHRRAAGLALAGVALGALVTVAAVSVLSAGPGRPPQQAELIAFSHFAGRSGRVGGRGVWLLGPTGARLIAPPARVGQTELSPDGSRIAFVGETCRGRRCLESLSVVGVKDHRVQTLTRGWRGVLDITWSPDGRRIAFSGDHVDRQSSIYVATVADGGVRRISDGHGRVIDDEPAWSPDGRSIAYRRVTTGWSIMRVVDVATGHTADISPEHFGGAAQPAWSPDGRWIAVAGESAGQQNGFRIDVYVMHPAGSDVTRLTAGLRWGAGYPQWSPTGDRLLVVQQPRPSDAPPSLTMYCSPLWLIDVNPASTPRRVGCGINSSWTAGGERIFYTRQTLTNPWSDPRRAAEVSIWSVAEAGGHAHRLFEAASPLSFPSIGT
jgi:dipeptidyl aminopeptidase/acylaminoacyl peptidase